MAGAALIGVRLIGYPPVDSAFQSVRAWFVRPSRSCRAGPRRALLWVVDRVGSTSSRASGCSTRRGASGFAGVPDPSREGASAACLPHRTGVELIGGPYLHARCKTNFTQFGEGKLFGRADWDRDDFVRTPDFTVRRPSYAGARTRGVFARRIPTWFMFSRMTATMLIGRVDGFEGDFIEGGRVEAAPGRLRFRDLTPGLDGSVVLRYHSVPYLRARPAVAIDEPEYREDDPVPFIRLRPPAGTSDVELELHCRSGVSLPVPRADSSGQAETQTVNARKRIA